MYGGGKQCTEVNSSVWGSGNQYVVVGCRVRAGSSSLCCWTAVCVVDVNKRV